MDTLTLVKRPKLANPWIYFLATYAWTWFFFAIAYLMGVSAESGGAIGVVLVLLALSGPAVIAIAFVFFTLNKEGQREYWRRMVDYKRISFKGYLVIFLLLPAISIIAAILSGYWDDYSFAHVHEEILECYPRQYDILNNALQSKLIQVRTLTDMNELKLFGKLVESGRIGKGECSAIACAIHNGFELAIDDKAAIKQARIHSENIRIIGTQGIITSLIKKKVLTIEEANEIKAKWEDDHRFKLKIKCFNETL